MTSTNKNPNNVVTDPEEHCDRYLDLETMEEASDYYEMIMSRSHKRLQVEMYKMEKEVVESGKECVICLREVEVGKDATVLPCKHVFHQPCVGHWLYEEHTCPTCRNEVWGSKTKELKPQSSERVDSNSSSCV